MKPTKKSRRSFIRSLTALGTITPTSLLLSSCGGGSNPETTLQDSTPTVDNSGEFKHGIASGDPLADSVIIWTRLTPKEEATQTVAWEVATDDAFTQIAASGDVSTDVSKDYTVKVDVTGLSAGTTYYYRFNHINTESAIGKTRTLPQGSPTAVKLAVFSCANYPAGFFNVYAEAAKRDDLDAAVFLGDYLYEYDKDGYATEDSEELDRVSVPANEIISVDDYRQRYAQYRTDEDLQALHANVPFIAVWDDHEFANDAYIDGAQNHNESEGPYLTRQANALKAYYEWMPIRQQDANAPLKIYRSFDFGDLLSLHMLDTRVIGRDKQLDYANYLDSLTGVFDTARFQAELSDQNRQLLGAEQTTWLQGQMTNSSAQWQVLGQQVLMGRMDIPAPLAQQQLSFSDYLAIAVKEAITPQDLTDEELAILGAPSIPYNLDAWDGYFAARETILGAAKTLDKDLVVLSGDTHNAWANDLKDIQGNQVGVEFATSSVSSPGFEDVFPDEEPAQFSAGVTQIVEDLKYSNTHLRGYLVVEFTQAETVAEWVYVDTVKSKTYSIETAQGKTLKVLPGSGNRRLV